MNSRCLYTGVVLPECLDSLGHMNFLEYQRIADKASDLFWLDIGGQMPSAGARLNYVVLETHVRYLRELRLADPITIDTRLVAYDQRRLHLHHSVMRGNEAASVVQILGLAFDLDTRRATRWPPSILERMAAWRTDAAAAELDDLMAWDLGSAHG